MAPSWMNYFKFFSPRQHFFLLLQACPSCLSVPMSPPSFPQLIDLSRSSVTPSSRYTTVEDVVGLLQPVCSFQLHVDGCPWRLRETLNACRLLERAVWILLSISIHSLSIKVSELCFEILSVFFVVES